MIKNIIAAIGVSFLLAACTIMPTQRIDFAETSMTPELSLEQIADNVWLHKSYEYIEPWGPVLSYGLVVKTDAGVFLVDTPWNDDDTTLLLELIKKETGETPVAAVITHAHKDKMGGVAALHQSNPLLRTYTHALSNASAPARDLTPTKHVITEFNAAALEAYYPGPGHALGNIVVYYAQEKILFAGCLIRPGDADNLGNTADADMSNWAQTIRNVAAQFPDAEIIIPGHGPPGGRKLLDHTIALLEDVNE